MRKRSKRLRNGGVSLALQFTGAILALACCVTVARSEVVAVHSSAVVDEALGMRSLAWHPRTIRSGPDGGSSPNTASGQRYDPSIWTAAIKTSLREKFGGSDMARGRNLPTLKPLQEGHRQDQ
jgi:hypothetical protein